MDVLTMLVPMQWQSLYGLLGLGIDIHSEMSYGGCASLLGTSSANGGGFVSITQIG